MAELEIRPTMRYIKVGYIIVAALLIAALIWWRSDPDNQWTLAAVIAAAVLLLWPITRHIKRQRVSCRLEGSNLRYSYGLVSTMVKTIPIAAIQDVTVRRSAGQRLWGVGNLRIETAGQASALEIDNIESPQKTADFILASAGKARGASASP
jgi:uncharacterized membrane protein YdbT with pleckstrin-like domain